MVSQEMADGQSAAQSAGPGRGEPPSLLVDAMLGKLARWLRLAGYDAEFWRKGSDEELMAAARAQGRLILTKDRALAGRRGVRAVLLQAADLDAQIREARAALEQRGRTPEPFTRCGECNGVLADLSRVDAEPLVPPYVWHTQREFRRCTRCGRVYWKGTHWPAVQGRLAGAAPGEEGEEA
ncbi:MAG: Mut7-C RNAse domain-containing protein [Nitrososphaerales archaeon]